MFKSKSAPGNVYCRKYSWDNQTRSSSLRILMPSVARVITLALCYAGYMIPLYIELICISHSKVNILWVPWKHIRIRLLALLEKQNLRVIPRDFMTTFGWETHINPVYCDRELNAPLINKSLAAAFFKSWVYNNNPNTTLLTTNQNMGVIIN